MAINKSKMTLLTPAAGRTTTGRDYFVLPDVPCVSILYVTITGGTATVDIEVSDDPAKTEFFAIDTLAATGVARCAIPASLIATNVTAISGATVKVRLRYVVLDSVPEYALDRFTDGELVPRRFDIQGTLIATQGTRKKLAQAQAATVATTIYTVPELKQAAIDHIIVANPTAGARTIKLWHDGSADGNVILPATTLLAGGFGIFSGDLSMETGDTLVAQSDAATAVTITVHGKEQAA